MTSTLIKILFCNADNIASPISKPTIDLADAFPILLFKEIIIVGLLNLSFILDAIIPITPSCQSSPYKTSTGSFILLLTVFKAAFEDLFLIFFFQN